MTMKWLQERIGIILEFVLDKYKQIQKLVTNQKSFPKHIFLSTVRCFFTLPTFKQMSSIEFHRKMLHTALYEQFCENHKNNYRGPFMYKLIIIFFITKVWWDLVANNKSLMRFGGERFVYQIQCKPGTRRYQLFASKLYHFLKYYYPKF